MPLGAEVLGDVLGLLELGGEVVPEELLGPQSLIAVCELLLELGLLELRLPPLLVLGLLLLDELGLEVEPLLELGAFEAELPGPQSVLIDLDVPLLVPALVPPVVPPVCAMAAVPSVKATIDVAVRRSRFIKCPPCCAKRVP